MCLSHEKIPLPERNPKGIQQGNRLMNRTDHSRPKWASLHIKFPQSIIRRGQGRLPPRSGHPGGGLEQRDVRRRHCGRRGLRPPAARTPCRDCPVRGAERARSLPLRGPSRLPGPRPARMTSASASISRRVPVRSSRIQNRSVAATVRMTSPRWKSLPLCHASIWSPTDNSPHDCTCCATSAVMACSFPRSGFTPASFRSPAPASTTKVSRRFRAVIFVCRFRASRFSGVAGSLPLP